MIFLKHSKLWKIKEKVNFLFHSNKRLNNFSVLYLVFFFFNFFLNIYSIKIYNKLSIFLFIVSWGIAKITKLANKAKVPKIRKGEKI